MIERNFDFKGGFKKIAQEARKQIAYSAALATVVVFGVDKTVNVNDMSDRDVQAVHTLTVDTPENYAAFLSVSVIIIPKEVHTESVEEKLLRYKQEFENEVVPVFIANQEVIAAVRPGGVMGDLEVLKENYSIYRAVGEKFDIPWQTPWMFHDGESTCSRDKGAFLGATTQYGAMQRETTLYGEDEIIEAAKGLEFLASLDQEHFDDWREIAWFGMKIDRDARASQKKYPYKDRNWALEDAFFAYNNNPGVAERRIVNSRILRGIFEGVDKKIAGE